MQEPEELPSLSSLEGEIRRFQEKTTPRKRARSEGATLAMQVGLELVCGVGVGVGIGIVLDKWLGTSPLFLVICFFLGAAGGGLTLYRTALSQSNDSEPTHGSNDSGT